MCVWGHAVKVFDDVHGVAEISIFTNSDESADFRKYLLAKAYLRHKAVMLRTEACLPTCRLSEKDRKDLCFH